MSNTALLKAVTTTTDKMIKQITHLKAIYTSNNENIDGYPIKEWQTVENTEEGPLYVKMQIQKEPFEDSPRPAHKTEEELWEVCKDIYREMYDKAEPSADFNKLKAEGGKLNPETEYEENNPFLEHYLPEEEQKKIINKHCIKNNLSEQQQNRSHQQ